MAQSETAGILHSAAVAGYSPGSFGFCSDGGCSVLQPFSSSSRISGAWRTGDAWRGSLPVFILDFETGKFQLFVESGMG